MVFGDGSPLPPVCDWPEPVLLPSCSRSLKMEISLKSKRRGILQMYDEEKSKIWTWDFRNFGLRYFHRFLVEHNVLEIGSHLRE
jgi:hypothetical protein